MIDTHNTQFEDKILLSQGGDQVIILQNALIGYAMCNSPVVLKTLIFDEVAGASRTHSVGNCGSQPTSLTGLRGLQLESIQFRGWPRDRGLTDEGYVKARAAVGGLFEPQVKD